ncbi:MAG: EamA family transporter [Spirochaetales bacterium]|nr:EamA family transporter [Spirochaetales bacterium]
MNIKSESKLKPILTVIAATMLFSIGAPISKITSGSPTTLIFFRCLTGLISFAVVKLIKKDGPLFIIKPSLILGGVVYAASSICFYTSLNYTTSANATVLSNTSPFFIAILGYIFLNEKPHKRDWIILLLIICGIVLCFYNGLSAKGSVGDLFALGAGLIFAMLAVIIKRSRPGEELQPLIWGNLFAIIITSPFLFTAGSITIHDLIFFVILGVFQMALPFFLYTKGQKDLGTMEASLFKLLEPILATIWTALLIKEMPGIYSILGGALVISALFIKTFLEYKNTRVNL